MLLSEDDLGGYCSHQLYYNVEISQFMAVLAFALKEVKTGEVFETDGIVAKG